MNQNKQPPKLVGIVGLGLIGGSLALDLQDRGWKVHGLVHQPKTAQRALERGVSKVISTNPNILSKCDLIILAIPLEEILNPDPELIKALPKNAVITDVGSVKQPVMEVWRELHPKFVGSHPMAGNSSSGVEASIKGLFKNRQWVSTPEEKTDKKALQLIREMAISLGSHWLTTDSKTHDQTVALISHLPVFVSAALLKTLNIEEDEIIQDLAKQIASSGFEDTSRVGGGNPILGASLASNNTENILLALAHYRSNLEEFEKTIRERNWSKLKVELEKTKELKEDIAGLNNKLVS